MTVSLASTADGMRHERRYPVAGTSANKDEQRCLPFWVVPLLLGICLCYGLNACLHQIHGWKPYLSVAVFGVRKWLRLNEVMRVGLWTEKVSISLRKDTREWALPLPTPVCTLNEERPCEDEKNVAVSKPKESSHRKLNQPELWSWTCSLQNGEKFLLLKLPSFMVF